jgi:type VI secretion system protein
MANQRLLERLRTCEMKHTESNHPDELLFKSIISHVHSILTTRRGTVPIADDFGLPDIPLSQGISLKESLLRIAEEIIFVIRKYEPRLKNVTIQLLSDKSEFLKQRFYLKGYLTADPSIMLEFEIKISSEAKVTITKKNGQE